jgi:hypothetical protein
MFPVAIGYVSLLSDSEKLMDSTMPTYNSFVLYPMIANRKSKSTITVRILPR